MAVKKLRAPSLTSSPGALAPYGAAIMAPSLGATDSNAVQTSAHRASYTLTPGRPGAIGRLRLQPPPPSDTGPAASTTTTTGRHRAATIRRLGGAELLKNGTGGRAAAGNTLPQSPGLWRRHRGSRGRLFGFAAQNRQLILRQWQSQTQQRVALGLVIVFPTFGYELRKNPVSLRPFERLTLSQELSPMGEPRTFVLRGIIEAVRKAHAGNRVKALIGGKTPAGDGPLIL